MFGSYPSAIAEAAWQLARTGKLWTALLDSLRPFFLGYGLAIVIGVPVGLIDWRPTAGIGPACSEAKRSPLERQSLDCESAIT